MFGLILIPLCGVVGASIDYTRAANQLSRLQAAVDATVLNVSRLPVSATDAEIQAAADGAVRPYMTNNAVQSSLSVTATRTGSKIVLSASGAMPTRFVSLFGVNAVPISAASTAEWGNTRLRLALALDVTGSMNSNGKLAAMQTAATNLLTQMQGAARTAGDVYVSIVPFAKDVNVGSSNYNGNWIKWSGGTDTWDENNGTCNVWYTPGNGNSKKTRCEANSSCSNSSYANQSSCTSNGTCSKAGNSTQSSCHTAGTCSNSSYTTQSTCNGTCSISGNNSQSSCQNSGTCSDSDYSTRTSCQNNGQCIKNNGQVTNKNQSNCNFNWVWNTWTPATWTAYTWTPATWTAHTWTQAAWTSNAHSTWNGCVMDRDQSYDTTNTAPGTAGATMFPAEQYSTCPAAMMELSYDWTALKAKITALTANGGTNQQIGLAWAFQSLTASPTTVPALDPNYNYNQAIILLSDGLNTQNRLYGDGVNHSKQVDDRQKLLCDAVKATGIKLYTVQVNTNGDPSSSVLQYCASTGKFFELTSATQIVSTFNDIGTELSGLRISR